MANLDIENPGSDGADLRSAFRGLSSRPNTIVLFGDSITAQNTQDAATFYQPNDYGFFTWAQALSGHRLEMIYNAGIPSERTGQILARVESDVVSQHPGYATVMAGTNDPENGSADLTNGALNNNDQVGATCRNLRSIYERLRATGTYVFALSILPRPTGSTQKKKDIVSVNRWIANYWRKNSGGQFVDAYDAIIQRNSATQGIVSLTLHDLTHPSNTGAYLVGKVLATAIRAIVPEQTKLVSSIYENLTNNSDSDVKSGNSLFLTTTAGIIDAPLTGVGPSGWRIGATAGGGGVVSVVAAPDGIGNAIQIAATGGADNDGVVAKYNTNIIGSGLAVGDFYYFEAMIRVVSPVQLKRIYSRAVLAGASNGMVWGQSGATAYPFPEGFDILMRSPVAQVPVGTTSLIWNALEAVFKDTGGSATLLLWRAALRKWSDPDAI